MRRIVLASLVFGLCFSAVPQGADAQERVRINRPFTGTRPLELDLHGGIAWWGFGVATGARFGIPILHNGFVSSINNAVYINFGADLYWIGYRREGNDIRGFGLGFPIALHWSFYFHERWSVYAEIGANIFLFHPRYFDDDEFFIDPAQWFILAVGGMFHINDVLAVNLRLGSPYASIGLTLMF
jgi:hypothetical protein